MGERQMELWHQQLLAKCCINWSHSEPFSAQEHRGANCNTKNLNDCVLEMIPNNYILFFKNILLFYILEAEM